MINETRFTSLWAYCMSTVHQTGSQLLFT